MAVIRKGVFSWTNFTPIETTEAAGRTITFLGFLDYPDLPESDGDLEHIVEDRDRLDKLADRFYGEQFLWHPIAVRNGIDLPDAELNPGLRLIIPDPELVRARIQRR